MQTISFKVESEVAREIRARARQRKLSVSEYLRRQALAACESQPNKVQLIKCPLTGAMIFEGLQEGQPLTVESTKAMLAEFP